MLPILLLGGAWLLQYAVMRALWQLVRYLLHVFLPLPQAKTLPFMSWFLSCEFSPLAVLHQVRLAVTDTA
jgi:hypothetical protein